MSSSSWRDKERKKERKRERKKERKKEREKERKKEDIKFDGTFLLQPFARYKSSCVKSKKQTGLLDPFT
jgi:hypothetical protein